MTWEIKSVMARIRALQDVDLDWKVARWFFEPPLPENVLEQWERKRKTRLPEDYRMFLTEIAEGGTGPGYGVARFTHQRLTSTKRGRTITVADLGCNLLDRLVIDGEHAGTMWHSEGMTISPITIDNRHATFSAWYEKWLNERENAALELGLLPKN